ncbi:MAG: hypothetical protein HY820_18635 [Acidobacteria bacterium]|nr:hypothetical protein [Acidobacteriota bacterium]
MLVVALSLVMSFAALAQSPSSTDSANSQPEEYKIYAEHPRLLMNSRRLRLIRRERERKTMRWENLQVLVRGKSDMSEPGFAYALFYLASEDAAIGKIAVQWALGAGADLRQLALVFDWCNPLLTESQSKILAAKIVKAMEREAKLETVSAVRNRVLAAAALADHVPDLPERTLREVFRNWWLAKLVPAIRKDRNALAREDGYPLLELMHVYKDCYAFDMRDNALTFFRDFPIYRAITYYPASFPAEDAIYHVPQYKGLGDPSVTEAALSRATDLSIVAFDGNTLEHQFLQGWLIQDRYIMRSAFAAPYEFLWANPYQPGLSYHHLPVFYHDTKAGILVLRSSWEEDAVWLSYYHGEMELFMDGKRTGLKPRGIQEPLQIGDHVVMVGEEEMKWSLNLDGNTRYFILGLKPDARYEIEVDDEEMREVKTDAGGILSLHFPASSNVGVLLRESRYQPKR